MSTNHLKDNWIASIKAFKKNKPHSLKDFEVQWCPWPVMANVKSVDEFVSDFVPDNGEFRPGDVVIGKFQNIYVLGQFNGRTFNEIERSSDRFFAYRWRETIREIFDLRNIKPFAKPVKNKNNYTIAHKDFNAKATRRGDTFTLLKLSEISKKIDDPKFRFYPGVVKDLKKKNLLVDHPLKDGLYLLKDNYKMSPSAAASLVHGSSRSGNICWKNEVTDELLFFQANKKKK